MSDEVLLPDDTLYEAREDRPVPCERWCGAAGTGKTYSLLKRAQEDPTWGLLTSTTGISAVNLGAITINSTLRYSNVESLRDAFLCGRLTRTLHDIALRYRHLIVEESSMADAVSLDLWHRGLAEANRFRDVETPLGLVLVGDLAQLPPVKGEWCFSAECWPEFAANTVRFERVWRQDAGPFLEALNLMRTGDGLAASSVLTAAGARWNNQMDSEFDGTTIVDMNDKVNRYNGLALSRVHGRAFLVSSRRWGQQRTEWSQNSKGEWGIPPTVEFKLGAYVMILSNAPDFAYVNGDCGHIVDYNGENGRVAIELVRNQAVVEIAPIVRSVELPEKPDTLAHLEFPKLGDEESPYYTSPHYRKRTRRYVTGQIEYYPLRLAYATTVHKSQSLTLDKVQIDFRGWMFKNPAMLYVALSRCRTLAGLRLVGDAQRFVLQCKTDARVIPWL